MTDAKKLFIKTYGCQMNVYDSERMAETLGVHGYVQTQIADDADMILLNTCHIREKAAEKSFAEQQTGISGKPGIGRRTSCCGNFIEG